MKESIIIKKLKHKVEELKAKRVIDSAIINVLKEELQYYVLNFIYNNPKYSHFTMYGGSLLRIVYELPRMSEGIDFQTDTEFELNELKNDLVAYFKSQYLTDIEVSINERPKLDTKLFKLSFNMLTNFNLAVNWTKLKLRIDINYFEESSRFDTEIIPKVHDDLAFSIKTYPLSTLMASKILAVLERTSRGIAGKTADCKPRDIYDLIWYLKQKTYPDLEYLQIKGKEYKNLIELFNDLKFRVANLDDKLFEDDLGQFFFDHTDYDFWFSNWRQTFLNLINNYKIFEIDKLEAVDFRIDFSTENRYLRYIFSSKSAKDRIIFIVSISDYWFGFSDIKIDSGHRVSKIEDKIESQEKLSELDFEYIGLFYKKIEDFIKRNNGVIYLNDFKTRLIRATADNLNPKEQIFLDKKLLEKIQFEELL